MKFPQQAEYPPNEKWTKFSAHEIFAIFYTRTSYGRFHFAAAENRALTAIFIQVKSNVFKSATKFSFIVQNR